MTLSTDIHDDIEQSQKEALLQREKGDSGQEQTKPMARHKTITKTMAVALSLLCAGVAFLACRHHRTKPMPLRQQPFRTMKDLDEATSTDYNIGEFAIVRLEEDADDHHQVGVDFPPIPPFHPKHTAHVHYSSTMDANNQIQYRRDINAPCEHGMLVFSVGVAKDDMPYTYEIYNDGYLYSNNGGLCILYPSYNGYQSE